MKSLTIACAAALSLSLLAAVAAEKKVDVSKLPPPADKKGVTYAKDIKPIFGEGLLQVSRAGEAEGPAALRQSGGGPQRR